ncbi:serine/threonine-protein kinase [Psychrobacter sp. Ps3]|uniref:serine/threonine protein kinase n=1 Tax=Psychrobacter sp. Ps3 TaxID=2790957 RepID=UPI001EDD0C19|nr:serine/threonine-protein kinase [Psychrobacter sp. Ps3]MCG3881752.1 serine/threonine protein kinase [Psychrobacter sp. Ps3]
MKDEESHGSKKQELQLQADKLLPTITHTLMQLGYLNIVHQRLSQPNDTAKTYQGLSRAIHAQFGQVMIKWQLSPDSSLDAASLNHEIKVLKVVNRLQSSNKAAQKNTTAPPVLAYGTLRLNILGQEQSFTWLAIPYYTQGSLAQHLKQPLTLAQKHLIIVKAAALIKSLHDKEWLHNDIKPSNILMDKEQNLLLTDFALARPIANSSKNKLQVKNSAGTPAYLAPELWQGQSSTVQSDIYAFGIMMYEVLAGDRPYAIESSTTQPWRDWAIQHCQQPIPNLPFQYSHYQDILDKALAKRTSERYLSMKAVLKDLQL